MYQDLTCNMIPIIAVSYIDLTTDHPQNDLWYNWSVIMFILVKHMSGDVDLAS